MPIASGANGWPNSYWGRPQDPGDATKVVMVKETVQESPPPPKSPQRSPPPPYRNQQEPEPGCCGGGGAGGAGAGCCGGASERRYKKGPNGELIYNNPGTPCRRICACICGLLLLLLLLGLILGVLFGLLPYLKSREAASNIVNVYPGGTFVNGIYYYPVPDPYNRYFFYNGPGIPCNPYNNNTDIQAAYDAYVNSILNPSTAAPVTDTTAAPGTTAAPDTGTASGTTDPMTTDTLTTDNPTTIMIRPLVTVPDCANITTSFVETWNYSLTTTQALVTTTSQNEGLHVIISLSGFMASLIIALVCSRW